MKDIKTSNSLKEFSWPDKSFSFKYPEFEGWSIKEIYKYDGPPVRNDESYIILLNYPMDTLYEQAPQIRVTRFSEWSLKSLRIKGGHITEKKNPQGILFDIITPPNEDDGLVFILEDFAVSITPIQTNKQQGFNKDKFFEEVINSFLTNNTYKN